MIRKRTQEVPICNLCKSKKFKVIYNKITYWEYKGFFRIVQCYDCGLIFTSPRPILSEMEKYYQQDNYFGRDIRNTNDTYNDKKERVDAYNPAYHLITSRKEKGSILDIGAGTGMFLSEFKDRGWIVDGVELESHAVSYAKKQYKITLRHGDFFQFKFQKKVYDCVTLNGVLEHLHDPLSTLTAIRPLLKRDGLLVLSIPNVSGIGRTIFGKNWFPWQPPRHLYHFSPITIREMLKNAGYTNINISHDYYLQNKYILFHSMRFAKSPKFQKKTQGGLVSNSVQIRTKGIKIQIGKFIWHFISELLARIEPIIKKGEVMLVYAEPY